MSFGSGSIPGYLQRLRNSKNRREKRQKEFKGGNDYSNVKSVKTEYDLPKFTNYNFSEFKKKIKEEAKQENNKQRNFLVLFAIAVAVIFLFFKYYKI